MNYPAIFTSLLLCGVLSAQSAAPLGKPQVSSSAGVKSPYGARARGYRQNRMTPKAREYYTLLWAGQDSACRSPGPATSSRLPPNMRSAVAHVNFMPADEGDRIEKVYGPNYQRLARIKEKYDPGNLFRSNQNIRPAKV